MARPVAADADATRQRILNSAAHLFATKGTGSTSMREIARAAKVSQSTVHHYFGSKEGLYQSCIEAMYSALKNLQAQLIDDVGELDDIDEVIAVIIQASYRFAKTHRDAVRLMTRDVLNHGESQHPLRADSLHAFLDYGGALLADFSALSPGDLRFALYTFTFNIVRLSLVEPPEIVRVLGLERDDEAAADLAIEAHLIQQARRLLGIKKTAG